MNARSTIITSPSRLHRRQAALRFRAGQSIVEYALILAFVSVVGVVVLSAIGVQINGVYTTIIDALDNVRSAI